LAVLFNKFYQECRIINEETKLKEARATLTYIAMKVIGDAMGLLGIECPEEM
ncbi:MAG: hypothetical protein GX913_00940, partial [Clostridiales bacterium]|nr:hypothetical protein [Clostridiales bacterium]